MAFHGYIEAQRVEQQRLDKIEELKKTIRFLLIEINHAISVCSDEQVNQHLSETLSNKRFALY